MSVTRRRLLCVNRKIVTEVSPETLTFSAKAQSAKIEVKSNGKWKVA